jgi:hypothetical protein
MLRYNQDFYSLSLISNWILSNRLDAINKTIVHQKNFIRELVNVSQAQPSETYQQMFQKSNENIDNFVRAFTAGNNYNFDTIDNTRENMKLYNKAIDAFNEYSTNAFNAWISFTKSFSIRR